jgi:hypothetical protein
MGRDKAGDPHALVDVCKEHRAQAESRHAAASKAKAAIDAKVAAQQSKCNGACEQYAKDPSPGNAATVHREKDDLNLLEIIAAQAARDLEAASDGVTAAQRALTKAETEVAAAERAKQVEELRLAASDEALDRAAAPLFAAMFEHHEAVKQAAQKIDDLYAASCSAAEQLRQMGETVQGEPVQNVGAHKLVRPIAERLIKANPARAASILGAIEGGITDGYAHTFSPNARLPAGRTFAHRFRNLDLDGDWCGSAEYTGAAQEQAIACLRVFFAARTVGEGYDAIRAERMKPQESEEPVAAPTAALAGTAPAPTGTLAGLKSVLKIFSGATGEMTEIRK